ncbi:MAG: glycosyltransferase family 2 protein [Bacteroidota bacterium]
MNHLVSIIVPCFNEEKYIGTFIENLLHQDFPKEWLEVFIIDGMSSDHTREIIAEYQQKHPFIQLLLNEKRFVPFALNLAIRKAKGDIIVRMDAHSGYPVDYVSVLVKYLIELNADNVGGIWITRPAGDSPKARAIAVAQSSVFGVGDSLYRLGSSDIRKVDTVPFGCFRKTVFDRIGLFDEELLRNQDDEFNARIIENGGSIYLIPGVAIDYYARGRISSAVKMFFQYAFFKPLVNRKLKKPATIRQFIPPLFFLFLLFGWLAAFIRPEFLLLYCCGVALYLVSDLFFTIKSAMQNGKACLLLYLPWLFFLQHMAYGVGYVIGFVNFVLIKKAPATITNSR